MKMIDKLAHATLEALQNEAVYAEAVDGDLGKCMVDGGLFDMRIVMRAALTAMLEPNQAMVRSGEIAGWDEANHMPAINMTETAYRAMIQAALDGKDKLE